MIPMGSSFYFTENKIDSWFKWKCIDSGDCFVNPIRTSGISFICLKLLRMKIFKYSLKFHFVSWWYIICCQWAETMLIIGHVWNPSILSNGGNFENLLPKETKKRDISICLAVLSIRLYTITVDASFLAFYFFKNNFLASFLLSNTYCLCTHLIVNL